MKIDIAPLLVDYSCRSPADPSTTEKDRF